MMSSTRPLILLSNDDGIHSQGLHLLGAQLARLGDVYVAAPHTERSAASHSLTYREPLHVEHLGANNYSNHVYAISGNPADCVLLALDKLLPRNPDLVVSGINRGVNLGPDILYSGTVGAAMEGAMNGFSAVAVSAEVGPRHEIRFDTAAEVAYKIIEAFFKRQELKGAVLNVNIPQLPYAQIKGVIGASTGSRLSWKNLYREYEDPLGRQTYWIGANAENYHPDPTTDCALLAQGWATLSVLTPSFFAPERQKQLVTNLPAL